MFDFDLADRHDSIYEDDLRLWEFENKVRNNVSFAFKGKMKNLIMLLQVMIDCEQDRDERRVKRLSQDGAN